MKLLKFLNEAAESRVKRITEDEFKEGLHKHCMQAISAIPIFRGDSHSFGFGFISPGKYERKSRNTSNWYTLIMNHSAKWSKFPKRSLICTFDESTADAYGGTYRVFPVDNSYIGICPKSDMWLSFQEGPLKANLETLNHLLNIAFQEAMVQQLKSEEPWNVFVHDDSFAQMKKYADAIPEWFENLMSDFNAKEFFKDLGYRGGDFIRFLEKMLDPANNRFLLSKISQIPSSLAFKNHEVWTDADCYMIQNTNTGINIMKDLGVKYTV